MGEWMAERLNEYFPIDVIVPVPNTPIPAAKALATQLDVPYLELLKVKQNNSRTFILPTQDKRQLAIQNKFQLDTDLIPHCQNKRMVLVDDSIVRGNTMRHIVELIKKTYNPSFLIIISLSPPIISTNTYGIDIPDVTNLIAYQKNNEQIARSLNVDAILYQQLDTFVSRMKDLSSCKIDSFEISVFQPKKNLNKPLVAF